MGGMGSGSNRHDREWDAITPNWSTKEEAKSFFHAYKTGRTTVERAAEDILMSPADLAELIMMNPEDEYLLRAIQATRQKTYETFLSLVATLQRVQ
jgi:hypothetical protein